MAVRILHEKMLANTLHMLELYGKQLKLAQELKWGIEAKINIIEEVVRANITGDKKALAILGPLVVKGQGNWRRYYDNGLSDAKQTKKVVQLAQEWRKVYEQKSKSDPVPALPEGDVSDAPREVPAAQLSAGAPLPDVESEGGNTD